VEGKKRALRPEFPPCSRKSQKKVGGGGNRALGAIWGWRGNTARGRPFLAPARFGGRGGIAGGEDEVHEEKRYPQPPTPSQKFGRAAPGSQLLVGGGEKNLKRITGRGSRKTKGKVLKRYRTNKRKI